MAADIGRLLGLLGTLSVAHLTESQLQGQLTAFLRHAFPDATIEREVRLTEFDRIDVMVDRIGIEVKQSGSVPAVRRQLSRYAKSPLVDELILFTTRVTHRELQGLQLGDITVQVVNPRWL